MPKGFKEMIAEANAAVSSISADDAQRLVGSPDVLFVDVREAVELQRTGKIPGAVHATRGMLEFYADPESPYHNPALDRTKQLVVSCASGGRSVLAAKTLKEMGFENVRNLTGGMNAWKEAGGPTEAHAA
ncbi:rhodanese-like domain-containing protein [Rhodospirillaceae bacterium SYSU D60014]|uniref:rhodanese-like domain-containing protein n=1 Tax=Virgifigura deserti TaxID=2268457 RepID=UPI000E669002